MRIEELIEHLAVRGHRGDLATTVTDVTHNTADVVPGSLYCCIPGRNIDGHDLAADAVSRGAPALLVQRYVDGAAAAVPQVLVDDVRAAMAPAAAACHGWPGRQLTLVGVTGTNGKTTTVHLVAACLNAAGQQCSTIGTMSGSRTTPESSDLQRQLAASVQRGDRAVAMEISSVAVAAHRVDTLVFDAAAFLNLGHDHLEVHGTMDNYFEGKAALFEPHRCRHAVVGEGPWGDKLADRLAGAGVSFTRFSLSDAADLDVVARSSRFRWRGAAVELHLDGAFNVSNAIAAAELARAVGAGADDIARGLTEASTPAGHAEDIECGQPYRVLVDYAHTPSALQAVLEAAREHTDGLVIVVFGCGGDRDPTKRAPMGRAAGDVADLAIVTSDNPRTEDPDAIIAAVVEGVRYGTAEAVAEPDRRAAIALAFERAAPGDVVVIAGKGHETGQVIGDTVHPFDDRAVARELLSAQ